MQERMQKIEFSPASGAYSRELPSFNQQQPGIPPPERSTQAMKPQEFGAISGAYSRETSPLAYPNPQQPMIPPLERSTRDVKPREFGPTSGAYSRETIASEYPNPQQPMIPLPERSTRDVKPHEFGATSGAYSRETSLSAYPNPQLPMIPPLERLTRDLKPHEFVGTSGGAHSRETSTSTYSNPQRPMIPPLERSTRDVKPHEFVATSGGAQSRETSTSAYSNSHQPMIPLVERLPRDANLQEFVAPSGGASSRETSASAYPNPQRPMFPPPERVTRDVKPQEYISCCYDLGFSSMAIQDDLSRAGYYVPSLREIEDNFINARSVARLPLRTQYQEQRWAFRYAMFNYKSMPSDEELFHSARARGFNLLSVEEVTAMRENHAEVTDALSRGPDENSRWEEAVRWADKFGYAPHEIEFLSLHWDDENGFVSKFAKVEEILRPSDSGGFTGDVGREWEGDVVAQEYVATAFMFGVPIAEIRHQLVIHGYNSYLIREGFLKAFLTLKGILPMETSVDGHLDPLMARPRER